MIAIDMVQAKLDVAKQLGADYVINASQVDPVAAVEEITKGEGVDVAWRRWAAPAPDWCRRWTWWRTTARWRSMATTMRPSKSSASTAFTKMGWTCAT
ncbi:MAG: zinc-binding dehydrogenase [Caldilineaceae bacterium]